MTAMNAARSTTLTEGRSLCRQIGGIEYSLQQSDCLTWMDSQPANHVQAIVTDPPYGLREYTHEEKKKLRSGRGGVWRIPPSYDGCQRSPVPRFTVLTETDRAQLKAFFTSFAKRAFRTLVPGGHLFIASSPLLSHLVYLPLMDAGFEKRGEVIRLVQTLRGGDRPKNAHKEFPGVTVMPRSGWEPWGVFRKPCEGRVQDNLRKWKTGGLRRPSADTPFGDVIASAPTRSEERRIAPHPSLKPQEFMRHALYRGVVGGGSRRSGGASCTCGITLETLQIQDRHISIVHRNQALVFEPGKGTRDHIPYRSDAAGNLMVGEAQTKCHWSICGEDGSLRFRKKKECESLSNLMK